MVFSFGLFTPGLFTLGVQANRMRCWVKFSRRMDSKNLHFRLGDQRRPLAQQSFPAFQDLGAAAWPLIGRRHARSVLKHQQRVVLAEAILPGFGNLEAALQASRGILGGGGRCCRRLRDARLARSRPTKRTLERIQTGIPAAIVGRTVRPQGNRWSRKWFAKVTSNLPVPNMRVRS